MELFIDTTKVEEVNRVSNIYPIKGITTNPLIFAKEFPDANLKKYYKTIKDLTKLDKPLFVQPTGDTIDEIIKESYELLNIISECHVYRNIYLKIPANLLGIEAIKRLHNENILATACMSWQQAMMFSQFDNVKYIAFYWSGMTDKEIDAAAQIKKGIEVSSRTSAKIMAAGFREWTQVEQAMQLMPHAITITPALFKEFDKYLDHPQTSYYCERFNSTYQKIKEK